MKSSFQRIIEGDLPASIVYRDELVIAFLDIHPYNPGHTLVVPLNLAASLKDLPEQYAARMFAIGRRIANAIYESGVACDGVNLKLNDGAAAGQDVMHCHLHVIPRVKDDRLASGNWITGDRWSEERRVEMDRIAASIRAKLAL